MCVNQERWLSPSGLSFPVHLNPQPLIDHPLRMRCSDPSRLEGLLDDVGMMRIDHWDPHPAIEFRVDTAFSVVGTAHTDVIDPVLVTKCQTSSSQLSLPFLERCWRRDLWLRIFSDLLGPLLILQLAPILPFGLISLSLDSEQPLGRTKPAT